MHIAPTFKGYLESEMDALIVLQGCLDGKLKFVNRRPSDIERPYLIAPGNIFVFRETQSGIKRWTDGITWSPSRISGRFLIYKELNKRAPRLSMGMGADPSMMSGAMPGRFDEKAILPVVYTGFVKKTFSFKMKIEKLDKETDSSVSGNEKNKKANNGTETFHIVSYYFENDVKDKLMVRPTQTALNDEVTVDEEILKVVDSLPQNNGKSGHSNSPHTSNISSPNVTNNSSALSSGMGSPITTNSSISHLKRKSRSEENGNGMPDGYDYSKRFKYEPNALSQPLTTATTVATTPVYNHLQAPMIKRSPYFVDVGNNNVPSAGVLEKSYSDSNIIYLPKPISSNQHENNQNRVLLLPCYESIIPPQMKKAPHPEQLYMPFNGHERVINMTQQYEPLEKCYDSQYRNITDSVNLAIPKDVVTQGTDLCLPRFIPPLSVARGKGDQNSQIFMQSQSS